VPLGSADTYIEQRLAGNLVTACNYVDKSNSARMLNPGVYGWLFLVMDCWWASAGKKKMRRQTFIDRCQLFDVSISVSGM